jgi:hypothetical protein
MGLLLNSILTGLERSLIKRGPPLEAIEGKFFFFFFLPDVFYPSINYDEFLRL